MAEVTSIRAYALVTAAYWGFTITDGALRMLVVLHFYTLGYSDVTIAFLFLFYEFFGIVTNLFGGWIASRSGLRVTLYGGLAIQIVALVMLALLQPGSPQILSVAYVMCAQALSGIAKDLTKMSAKSAIKVIVSAGQDAALFNWVARLTGSKNALKGVGFFVGGLLLASLGFDGALYAMAIALVLVLAGTMLSLSGSLGKSKKKVKFTSLLSKSRAINWLSFARLFLFASRDVWFVVGLPVFLSGLGLSFTQVGGFLALWVIGYGIVQAAVPNLLRLFGSREAVTGKVARNWAFALLLLPLAILGALKLHMPALASVTAGLAVFAVVFAVNSAVHSYLVLAYSDADTVSVDVGFYYMANAGGRLLGTLLSGLLYEYYGFAGCLLGSAALVLISAVSAFKLPRDEAASFDGAVPTSD